MADRATAAPEDLQREPGGALAAIGALALLVSLWLPWFGRVSGWNVFEVWDVVLAALAVATLVVVAGRLGFGPRRLDGWLWVSGIGTVVIVVENLINRPPIVQVASALSGARISIGVGIWVALAAGVAMLAGAALVWRGVGAPDEFVPAENDLVAGEPPPATTVSAETATGPDEAAAARRAAIAAALVRAGFIAPGPAAAENPAVEVLADLLPPAAEINLCLTYHEVSSSGQYTFTENTGQFPHLDESPAQSNSRRAFVVCTKASLCWTASHALSVRYDGVTLHSVPFRDILGAAVRHRRKGIVDVWIDDGATLSFRVAPNAVDALQTEVDRAAQSQ